MQRIHLFSLETTAFNYLMRMNWLNLIQPSISSDKQWMYWENQTNVSKIKVEMIKLQTGTENPVALSSQLSVKLAGIGSRAWKYREVSCNVIPIRWTRWVIVNIASSQVRYFLYPKVWKILLLKQFRQESSA